jgi:hypothetical protein
VRSGGKFRAKGVLILVLSVTGALDACSDSSGEKLRAAQLAQSCVLDTDCENPLICAFERCHFQCAGDKDCHDGARCVRSVTGDGICQLVDEKTCRRDRDCVGEEVCAEDAQCRDHCSAGLVCLDDAVCAVGGVCASKGEVDGQGNLVSVVTSGGSNGGNGTGGGNATGGSTSGNGSGGATGGAAAGGGGAAGDGEGGGGAQKGGSDSGAAAGIGGTNDNTSGSGGTSASNGGKSGNGNEAGTGASSGASTVDVDEVEPNETRETPMPLGLESSVHGSFSTNADADFYEVVTPASDVAGGYFEFSITDIPQGEFSLSILSKVNYGVIGNSINTATVGQSYFGYWAAAPDQTYLIKVSAKAGQAYPYDYVLNVKYTPVVDALEPNDTRQTASDLTLGEPVQSRLFSGYRSDALTGDEYNDWYRVELAAGPLTAALTHVPASANGQVDLYNSGGTRISTQFVGTHGADATLSYTIASPGIYYLVVTAYDNPAAIGKAATPGQIPAHFTDDYTFTVTQ